MATVAPEQATPSPAKVAKAKNEYPIAFVMRMVQSLVRGPSSERRVVVFTLAIFFGFGLLGAATTATMQSLAIGFPAARLIYQDSWVQWILWPTLTPLLFWGVLVAGEIAVRVIGAPFRLLSPASRTSARRIGTLLLPVIRWGFICTMLALMFGLFCVGFYLSAKNAAKLPPVTDSNAGPQLQEAVSTQASANQRLSADAEALLAELDSTQQQVAEARERLTSTLLLLDRQRDAIGKTSGEVDELVRQGQFIKIRNEQLRALLDGQEPVTRSYFDRSGTMALILSALLGGGVSWFVSGAPGARRVISALQRPRGPILEAPPQAPVEDVAADVTIENARAEKFEPPDNDKRDGLPADKNDDH